MNRLSAFALAAIAILALGQAAPAVASEQQELVVKARFTAEKMLKDPDFETLQELMREARAVLIIPNLLKGGFIFGAEGGSGVLLAKTKEGGWSYPAFYTMAGASFGFQFGGQAAEVMLVIRSDGALNALINNQVRLGGDASIAVGPVGAGVKGSTTTNLEADIISFSRAKGLYGGVSFEGAVIAGRDAWNEDYYGPGATTKEIIIARKFSNPKADGLRAVLAKF